MATRRARSATLSSYGSQRPLLVSGGSTRKKRAGTAVASASGSQAKRETEATAPADSTAFVVLASCGSWGFFLGASSATTPRTLLPSSGAAQPPHARRSAFRRAPRPTVEQAAPP